MNDRETGRSRGFGFVTFREEHALREAIEGMNGQSLDGRNITVNEAQSRATGGFRQGGAAAGGRREAGYGYGYGRRDSGPYAAGAGRGFADAASPRYGSRAGGPDRKWRN